MNVAKTGRELQSLFEPVGGENLQKERNTGHYEIFLGTNITFREVLFLRKLWTVFPLTNWWTTTTLVVNQCQKFHPERVIAIKG